MGSELASANQMTILVGSHNELGYYNSSLRRPSSRHAMAQQSEKSTTEQESGLKRNGTYYCVNVAWHT